MPQRKQKKINETIMQNDKQQQIDTVLTTATLTTKTTLTVGMIGVFFIGMGFLAAMATFGRIGAVEVKPVVSSCPVYSVGDFTGSESEDAKVTALRNFSHNDCNYKLTDVTGTLSIMVADNFEDSTFFEEYSIQTEKGEIDLYFANKPHSTLTSGSTVEISGYPLNGGTAILFDASRELQGPADIVNIPGYRETDKGTRGAIEGTQQAHMVLTYPSGESQPSKPDVQEGEDTMHLIDLYYDQASFGAINFASDVQGWYEVDYTRVPCEDFSATEYYEAVFSSLDGQIDFTGYDGEYIIIVAPYNCTSTWIGLAWRSPRTVTLPGGQTINVSVSMIDNSNFPGGYYNHPPSLSEINNGSLNKKDKVVMVMGHEIGHNLGHHHASFFRCNIHETPLFDCTIGQYDEYYDGYEIMGNWGPHSYNAKHKAESGWLTESNGNLSEVTESGTFDIYPIQYQLSGKLQGLKIPRMDGEYLWVEYRGVRDNSTFDWEMAHWQRPPTGSAYTGAMLHIDDPVKNRSFIFYPQGDSSGHAHPDNVLLHVGETFTDPLSGTQLETLAMYPDSENPENSYVKGQVTSGTTNLYR